MRGIGRYAVVVDIVAIALLVDRPRAGRVVRRAREACRQAFVVRQVSDTLIGAKAAPKSFSPN
jgi:hypothetical protein